MTININDLNATAQGSKTNPVELLVEVGRLGEDRDVITISYANKHSVSEMAQEIARLVDVLEPEAVRVNVTGVGGAVVDQLIDSGLEVPIYEHYDLKQATKRSA